ncbi:MAG: HAMP domain-containing sensor histidine kinase [Candidatus Nitrosotenuis sp.]
MFNTKISKTISLIPIAVGLAVAGGWVFDVAALKSVVPQEVTMKFSTAISFVFSGIMLYFVSNHFAGKIGNDQIAIPISGLVIFLFMASLLTTSILGIPNGIEQLFVTEAPTAVKTTLPGIPSIPTIINFLLIVVVGMISLNNSYKPRPIRYIGYVIMTVGAVSLIGHLSDQPLLYYYIENISTAMAIHTGILFVLIGYALSQLKSPQKLTYTTMKIQTKLLILFLTSSIIPIIFIMGLNYKVMNSDISQGGTMTIGLVTATAVSLFSIFTARSISQPIVELKKISTRISEGDFTVKAPQNSNDEIGQLSKSFNQMIDNVIKAERLSTIGLLASRLGHDLRNNLTTIITTSGIIRKKPGFDKDRDLQWQVNMIERAAQKINYQIEDVLNFVRFSPLKSEHVRLSKILNSTIKSLHIPPKIKVVLPQTDLTLNCNANQFEIVLTNLINNSIQAMGTDGEIVIDAYEDDQNSIIKVKDSGPGIPNENLAKIFEPLFTTKQQGTGLGLATCRNIVNQYGGTIDVRNNPTTFIIKIPK